MSSLSQKIYRLLTDATEEEVLHPDGKVEREAPANFVKLLIARMASKLGDRLASPKTTLMDPAIAGGTAHFWWFDRAYTRIRFSASTGHSEQVSQALSN